MAKEIENSLARFSSAENPLVIRALTAVVLGALLGGFVNSLFYANWTYAFLFAVSGASAAVYAYINSVRARRLAVISGEKRLDWQTAIPEIQRQNLSLEVVELAKILEIETEQISDLQSAYIVAEDLALRQIQQEEGVPLMRHVSVCKAPFDSVFVKEDVIVCVEVSFLVAPDIRQERIDAVMRKISLVSHEFERINSTMKVRLMLVLVTQLTPEDDAQLRVVLNKRRFPATPVDIDIRFLDFEALQRMYVTDVDQ